MYEYYEQKKKAWIVKLRKKCPYLELFQSAFFRIRTEYGEILYEYGHFSYSLVFQYRSGYQKVKLQVVITKFFQPVYKSKVNTGFENPEWVVLNKFVVYLATQLVGQKEILFSCNKSK